MQTLTRSIILLLCLFSLPAAARYRVMFSNNYPPYNFRDEEGKLVGFNIDILQAINQLYNSELDIEGGDWTEINKMLEAGDIQAIGGVDYDGTPDNQFLYTRSVINTSHCFLYNRNFVNKISPEIVRMLPSPLITLWKNDVLIRYIRSLNPNARFLFVDNYTDMISNLDRSDVNCAISTRTRGMYFAEQMGKNYIASTANAILEQSIGFRVNRKAPELQQIIDNGLEVIMSNGEYQQIYNKWIRPYRDERNDWQSYLKYIVAVIVLATISILLLSLVNHILQVRVRKRTEDLERQLYLNSKIMRELEEQKEKAVESERMKSVFLANMSHEIRTPMNGILGFSEILKSQIEDEQQLQFIDIIIQSGERMLGTINNVIEISKIESGVEKVRITAINFRKMIAEWKRFFTMEAERKGIRLRFEDLSPESGDTVYSDDYKLNSILTNLIRNAIKYTIAGEVVIRYQLTPTALKVAVSDTGIGIEPAQQKVIFEQFVQADPSHSSGYEGSGLGLSITKAYLLMLNGTITLHSEPGKGSTFNISIPTPTETELAEKTVNTNIEKNQTEPGGNVI